MTRSSDEREIRDAVVARLRELMPDARIVHELNVAGQGSNRIDVAAIGRQTIVGCEIKSRKDTLKRLPAQWEAFSQCCHYVFVVAHEKHFETWREDWWREDVPAEVRIKHPEFHSGSIRKQEAIWRFPRPARPSFLAHRKIWTFDAVRDTRRQPAPRAMLDMLWADELRAECAKHQLYSGTRTTRTAMIDDMLWRMTGQEIVEAVCRQLRRRAFPEADAAMIDARAAA